MKVEEEGRVLAPTRVLEMLRFRFGAFESIADAVLSATSYDIDRYPPMDHRTAWAIHEFAEDLRQASEAAEMWMERHEKSRASNALGFDGRRPRGT